MNKNQRANRLNLRKIAIQAIALLMFVCLAVPMTVFAAEPVYYTPGYSYPSYYTPPQNNEAVTLSYGIYHANVVKLQTRLMELGFMDEDEPTNYYGSMTQHGVELFQRKNGLKIDGIAGEEVLALIYSDSAKPYSVSNGISGTDVEELQKRLNNLGYMDSVTGYFGDETEAAARRFQERNNIEVDGTIGRQTREKLYSADVRANAFASGEEGSMIKEYQLRLKELGYLSNADGKFGDETDAAVKRFQERNGLIPDGYIGQETRALLNSGESLPNALTLGADGADVEKIQKKLSALNYMSAITGYFGEITQDAVQDFQRLNGLAEDGTVGVKTMSRLFSSDAVANSLNSGGDDNKNNSPSKKDDKKKDDKKKKPTSSNNSSNNDDKDKDDNVLSPSDNDSGDSKGVEKLISVAKGKLGSKYVRGAKGPNKFDCSGFVYWCLNQSGVKIGYMTSGGWKNPGKFKKVSKLDDVKRGDILVFRGHVGISTGKGHMIDASSSSGKVVSRGATSSYWQKNFICAYRVF